jgi:tRNA modification GTPase
MFNASDTIAAVSSAAGRAGRAIVRLSGPRAIALAEGVFSAPLAGVGGFRAVAGQARLTGSHPITIPARVYVFRAPRSYTRQDVVELHVPGELVASLLLLQFTAADTCSGSPPARPAEAGEFTARAFLSGRLDLSRAQAVADVIDAQADAQLRSAIGMMRGALARLCQPPAQTLAEALALTEASIDFADEGVELAPVAEVATKLAGVAAALGRILAMAGAGSAGALEPKVAIAGRSNAGKSSLLNALGGVDRAIVSALAGTTRDVLSAPATLAGGVEVMLLDAAGLDATPDPLAPAAHAAAREAVASADAILFVIDAADGESPLDTQLLAEVAALNPRAPLLVLANKVDLVEQPVQSLDIRTSNPLVGTILPVSAVTGAGLDELRRVLGERLATLAPPVTGQLLLHDRQRRSIAGAAAAANAAMDLLVGVRTIADVAELLAMELRAALHHLRELTGEVVTEDILSAIFARFCVGK